MRVRSFPNGNPTRTADVVRLIALEATSNPFTFRVIDFAERLDDTTSLMENTMTLEPNVNFSFAVFQRTTEPEAFDNLQFTPVPEPTCESMLCVSSRLPLLDINDAVIEAFEAYIVNRVMPKDPGGDAFHLAAASFHRRDFLVTWNCQHIANANKFGHIRRVNGILGLGNPALVTPLELLNEELGNG